MTFGEFEARAREVFERIPNEFRSGVDGLEVERRIEFHPTLPEVYTLGECRTETYPSEFGGAGEVRSMVVLYYGSFLRLSRTDERWDWEEEIFETVTHEIRHHLESLASDDALELQDYMEDQNFLRRQGEPFDPLFYRAAPSRATGVYEVAGDAFVEREVRGGEVEVEFDWEGRRVRVPLPEPLGEPHFLSLEGLDSPEDGELLLVLVRRSGPLRALRALMGGEGGPVLHSSVRVGEREMAE